WCAVGLHCAIIPTQEGPMHPRERPTTRRQFLIRAGVTVGALSGADALLSACGGSAKSAPTTTAGSGVLMGPGGIPLARRDHPVTLPIYGDNGPIDSGLNLERSEERRVGKECRPRGSEGQWKKNREQ